MRPGSPGHTCDFWTPILCAHTGLRNSLLKPIRHSASIIAARPMARFVGAAVAVCGSDRTPLPELLRHSDARHHFGDRNYRVGAHSGCGEMTPCDSGLQQQAPLASIAELGRQVFIGDCRVGRTREQHHHEREGHRGAEPDEQTQPERGERIADNGEAAWMKDSASCVHFLPFAVLVLRGPFKRRNLARGWEENARTKKICGNKMATRCCHFGHSEQGVYWPAHLRGTAT
jgi:hypothetical protein